MRVSQFSDAVTARYRLYQDRLFDYRYGLDTRQDHVDYVTGMPSGSAQCAIPYEPIQAFMFHRMMAEISIEPSRYSFVDLGSGKGRAVVLAAKYGFAKVFGVELSAQLHAIAQQNAQAFKARVADSSPIELICGDARTYELPSMNLVLFLYNPFVGEVLEDVAAQVDAFLTARRGDLWVLYRNPQNGPLMNLAGLKPHAQSRSYVIYRRIP